MSKLRSHSTGFCKRISINEKPSLIQPECKQHYLIATDSFAKKNDSRSLLYSLLLKRVLQAYKQLHLNCVTYKLARYNKTVNYWLRTNSKLKSVINAPFCSYWYLFPFFTSLLTLLSIIYPRMSINSASGVTARYLIVFCLVWLICPKQVFLLALWLYFLFTCRENRTPLRFYITNAIMALYYISPGLSCALLFLILRFGSNNMNDKVVFERATTNDTDSISQNNWYQSNSITETTAATATTAKGTFMSNKNMSSCSDEFRNHDRFSMTYPPPLFRISERIYNVGSLFSDSYNYLTAQKRVDLSLTTPKNPKTSTSSKISSKGLYSSPSSSVFIYNSLNSQSISDIDQLTNSISSMSFETGTFNAWFWSVFERNNAGSPFSGGDPLSLHSCVCSGTGKTVFGSCSCIGHMCSGIYCVCGGGGAGARLHHWSQIASFTRKLYTYVENHRVFELFTLWYFNNIYTMTSAPSTNDTEMEWLSQRMQKALNLNDDSNDANTISQ